MSRHFLTRLSFFTWKDCAEFSDEVADETIHSHLKSVLFCIHSSSHSSGVYSDYM